MAKNFIFIFLIGAGLTACSSFSPKSWDSQTIIVDAEKSEVENLEDQIKPYRDSLAESMNLVIAYSKENLVKGRPCSYLNNWAADALLLDQDSLANILSPNMALLNVGGLRSTINAGDITVGDIYTFMPFDNLVVWVKMPITSLHEIASYLRKSGGEPIANAQLNKEGIILSGGNSSSDYFWIVTSDYLMNGGDNMSFFDKKMEIIYTDKLLRDSFLEQVKVQGTLEVDKKCRINVE